LKSISPAPSLRLGHIGSFLRLPLLITSLIMFTFSAIINVINLRLRDITNNVKLQLRITRNKLEIVHATQQGYTRQQSIILQHNST